MNQKWNLQDIRPAQSARRKVTAPSEVEVHRPTIINRPDPTEESEDSGERITIQNGGKQKSKSLIVALVVFFSVLGGGLFVSALMGGSEVTVYPRFKEPNVNALFEAHKIAESGELAFELMTLEAEGERQVKASGEEEVTQQATGSIFIYNEAQKEPLRLVTNTRFESPEGRIFKIKDSVIVPGYTEEAGKKTRGMATAQVYADEVGDAYNISPSRFTVPGFKGEPEYEKIYAESTESFTGGYSGKKFIIDETELQTAKQALQTELRNSLIGRIDGEKPANFTVFKDAVTFTYESLPSVAYGEDLATIKERVLLRIPIFKDDAFATHIAEATVPGYTKEPIRVADSTTLSFAYKVATTASADLSAYEKIEFNLIGKPQLIWKFDSEKLKADLLNANKTALNVVLGGYPAIEKATAVIRPFWKSKFPTDINDIKIIEIIGEKAQ